ncbi:hypothetical protein [Antrihabitans cavernicola]|uniref:Uncharacterized protein n=1 Tax=Antrihabitans cavernicola TaxID=2495913 RepID=A0A5A7SGL3_9NOCA|nr:hypothetical protein [Spelaeibacter cavernicola]KAA0024744.1 hypothetical protein FOY51_02070 [Spelaeibacter cavernicola]
MELSDEQRHGLNTALSEATYVGLTIDEAAATVRVELQVLALPAEGPATENRTVILALTGVGRIAASLRKKDWYDEDPIVEPLDLAGIDAAVRSFGGGALHGWEFFDLPDSSWTQWRELLSLDTKVSDQPADHVVELYQQDGVGPRELDMRIWFTDVSIRNDGDADIPLQDFIDGGARWWDAHDHNDPRAVTAEVAPPL